MVSQDQTALPTRTVVFEDFFRLHHEPVLRAVCTTLGGDIDLAADAVDEAMARAYQRWSKVRNYANAPGWVYRVALNYSRTRLRRRRREPHVAVEGVVSDRADFDPAIYRVLMELPLEQRAVIVLKYLIDWTIPEIAVGLGLPEGTVKSRLGRGLARLREETSLEL